MEKEVAKLATLLNQKPEQVEKALNEGKLGEVIDSFVKDHTIMTNDEFEGLKTNLKTELIPEVKNQVIDEISGGSSIPKPIYDKVKGNVLEMTEKALSKKYDVNEFNGIDDLVSKIVESHAKDPEVEKYVKRINELTAEHEQEVEALKNESKKRFISSELNRIYDSIPIDAEDVKLENQRKILRSLISSEFEFDVDNDRVVIKKAPIEHLKKNLDPLPIDEVILNYAKDFVNIKSSDGGGRGSGSSAGGSKIVNIKEYCEKNGIAINSPEHAKVFKEFTEKGYEII